MPNPICTKSSQYHQKNWNQLKRLLLLSLQRGLCSSFPPTYNDINIQSTRANIQLSKEKAKSVKQLAFLLFVTEISDSQIQNGVSQI